MAKRYVEKYKFHELSSKMFLGGASFVDHSFYFWLVILCFHAHLFIDALWSPAGKGLTSWLSFVMSNCEKLNQYFMAKRYVEKYKFHEPSSKKFLGGVSFVDHSFYFWLVMLCFHARLFIDALWSPAVKGLTLWSPAGKGLTSWLSFVMSNCEKLNQYFMAKRNVEKYKFHEPSSKKFLGVASFVDHSFCFWLVILCFHARLFIDALWSPAGKGLTSWLSFVMSNCEFVLFDLILYVPSNIFQLYMDVSSWVEPVLS